MESVHVKDRNAIKRHRATQTY